MFYLKSKYIVMNIGVKYCNNVVMVVFFFLIEVKYVYCIVSILNRLNKIILIVLDFCF